MKPFFKADKPNSAYAHLAIIGSYLLLTILLTWPLPLHMGSIPSGDGYTYVHSFWWFKKALFTLQNPFQTDYVFYPQGVNLVFNGGVFSSFLLTLPISMLWGLPEAINASHMISFTLSGYFTFLLCLELKASPAAAFLAGLLYAFNPYHFSHFPSQLNLSELQWIPLYLLLLKRTLERAELCWPVCGGVCAVVCMMTDSIQMIIVAIMTAVVILWQIGTWRGTVGGRVKLVGIVRRVAIMILVAAVVSSGYLWQVFLFLKDSRGALLVGAFDLGGANMFSADLAGLISPWRKDAVYLGIVAMTLAAWGAWKQLGDLWVRILLSMVLIGVILSLGPTLHMNGQWTRSDGSYLKLPFFYLSKLPMFAEVRTPYRFHIITMLGISLLACLGFQSIKHSLSRYKSAVMLFGGCAVLLIYEYYPGRKTYEEPAPVPSIYYEMAKDEDTYSVLQLPLSRWSALNGIGPGRPYVLQYYQTVHGKKIFGGLVARASTKSLTFPDYVLETIASMNSHERYRIYDLKNSPLPEEIDEVRNLARVMRGAYGSFIQTCGTRYVVLHGYTARPDSLSRVFIEEFLQKKIIDDSKDGIAYVKL